MPTDHVPEKASKPAGSFRRKLLWLLIVTMSAITLATVVFVQRVQRQSALVARLQNSGARAMYSYDDWRFSAGPGVPVPAAAYAPKWLRKRLDPDCLDIVRAVYALGIDKAEATPLKDEQMASICEVCRKLPTIRKFAAKNNSFRVGDIASWPHFKELTVLELMSNGMDDDDLKVIAEMPNLRRLFLESSRITDIGVRHLAKLSHLQKLVLRCPAVTNAGLQPLSTLNEIEELTLACPAVTDEGLLHLSPSQLSLVRLDDMPVTDGGVMHLVSGGRLQSISVRGAPITDACFAELAKCPRLWNVDLIRTKVTGAGLGKLASTKIDHIVLDDCPITDEGLRQLENLKKDKRLSTLSLRGTQVTGEGLKALAGCTVFNFDLSDTRLLPAAIADLAKIKCFTLRLARTTIGDDNLSAFLEMDDANELDVKGTKVTAQGIRRFEDARQERCARLGIMDSLRLTTDFSYEEIYPPAEAKDEAEPSAPNEQAPRIN